MAVSKSFKMNSGMNQHDSELITTKVCSQNGITWNVMFENHVVPIFHLEIF